MRLNSLLISNLQHLFMDLMIRNYPKKMPIWNHVRNYKETSLLKHVNKFCKFRFSLLFSSTLSIFIYSEASYFLVLPCSIRMFFVQHLLTNHYDVEKIINDYLRKSECCILTLIPSWFVLVLYHIIHVHAAGAVVCKKIEEDAVLVLALTKMETKLDRDTPKKMFDPILENETLLSLSANMLFSFTVLDCFSNVGLIFCSNL